LHEIDGCPAKSGEAAPDGQRPGDHPASAGAIRKHRQRHAKDRIEDRERETGDRPELGIGELKVLDDRSGKDVEDRPVEEVEDLGDKEVGKDDGAAASRVVTSRIHPSLPKSCASRSTSASS
jgi:hypothetical protein